jgi:hypothetical protein
LGSNWIVLEPVDELLEEPAEGIFFGDARSQISWANKPFRMRASDPLREIIERVSPRPTP